MPTSSAKASGGGTGPTTYKPLHLAKTMTDLNVEGDKIDKKIENSTSQQLVVSIDKLQKEGYKALADGDLEKAYVFFYRVTKTFLLLHNRPDFKKYEDYLNQVYRKKLDEILSKCEELGNILTKRYNKQYPQYSEKALLDKLSTAKKTDVKSLNGIREDLPSVSEKAKQPEIIENGTEALSESILVDDLRKLMEQQSTRLLIIDCRALSSFEKSHVKHCNCISFPDSILEKGLSANKLTEKLKTTLLNDGDDRERQLSLWNSRQNFDRIILYDWNSSYDNRDSDAPISVLYDALTKWDLDRKYSRPPEIVTGGFREITYKYPTLLTNPTPGSYEDLGPTQPKASPAIPDLSSILYPSFDEEDLSARANKLRLADSSDIVNNVNNNLPGRVLSAVITPDRSTKPTKLQQPRSHVPETSKVVPVNPETAEYKESPESRNDPVRNTIVNPVPKPSQPAQSSVRVVPPDRNTKPPLKFIEDPASSITPISNGYPEDFEEQSLHKSREGGRPSIMSTSLPARQEPSPSPEKRPAQIITPKGTPITYGVEKIKDEAESAGLTNGDATDKTMKNSMMKRSRSMTNLKKSGDEENLARVSRIEQKPTYERSLKPVNNRSSFESYAGRRREFEAVSSSTHCVTGLKNLGNTCYMNSILQCLLSTPQLVDYFLGTPGNAFYSRDINPQSKTKGHTTEEFAAVIREITNGHKSIALNDFVSVTAKLIPNARYGEQQDSHEFLVHLINSLHDELNRVRVTGKTLKEQNNDNLSDGVAAGLAWDNFKSLNDSIMIDLFWGQQKSCVTCLNCGKRSVTFDMFSVLSIPIRSTKRCDIKSCLDLYTTEEEISEYLCLHCKRKGRGTKKLDLWKLPMYLIIQFQRFYDDGFLKKKVTEVDFPIDNLDLTPYVKSGMNNNRYNLYGVSNHMGTMEGGHYTAYCRRSGNWYEFDDSIVRQLRKQDIVTQNGYIVFYQRSPH